MSLGEPKIKQALDWIVARLAEQPHASRSQLIGRAAREFDLTPVAEDFLRRQLVEATRGQTPGAPGA
jgi:hypothetical protein